MSNPHIALNLLENEIISETLTKVAEAMSVKCNMQIRHSLALSAPLQRKVQLKKFLVNVHDMLTAMSFIRLGPCSLHGEKSFLKSK